MNKTNKLKQLILNKYGSIREFSRIVQIPSTTLTSALDKGIGGMAVDRVIKICDILNIDIKTFDPLDQDNEIFSKKDDLDKNKVNSFKSVKEQNLLSNFYKLNDLGKDEAIKRVYELTQLKNYTEKNTSLNIKTIAAHNDHLTEYGEIDRILEDIKDMNNW
ncbi:MAG: hypothetical protein ACLTUR_00565 [Paraclostridium sordellii]